MASSSPQFLLVFLCLATIATTTFTCSTDNLNSCLFGGDFEFIDLTHPFNRESTYWPNSRRFEFVKQQAGLRPDGSWYAANDFCAGEHGGTHIDAPYHFSANGQKVGDIGLDKLIAPLYLVDISSQVNDNPSFVLYKHNLNHMLNVFDTTQPCVVIFKFGWTKFYSNPIKYLGTDGIYNSTLNFPGLSSEVAQFIVSSYPNVVGVGVDVASVDPGSSTDYQVHRTLHQAGLYHMENVKLDRNIPEIKCTALVLPMKIGQGSGAPLRLAAICPKEEPRKYNPRDYA